MKTIKRLMDLAISFLCLIALSPLLLIITVLIKFVMGPPIIFRQQRPGLDGKPFEIYKFRTMNKELDSNGNLLPDHARLGKLGRFLRATSIDELPELLNILKSDMSIVGPRPLLMQYLNRYSPLQARRHEVKPGLTGWAQVNGRNALNWEEKFDLDVWYVDNWSIKIDLKIMFMTVKKVFLREGISSAGEATMPEFLGHAKTQRR